MVKRSDNLFKRFGRKVMQMFEKAKAIFKPKDPTKPQEVEPPEAPIPPTAAEIAKPAPEVPDIFKDSLEELGVDYSPETADIIQEEFKLNWYHTHDYYQDLNDLTNLAITAAGDVNLSSFDLQVLKRKTKDVMRDYVTGMFNAPGVSKSQYEKLEGRDKLNLLGEILRDF